MRPTCRTLLALSLPLGALLLLGGPDPGPAAATQLSWRDPHEPFAPPPPLSRPRVGFDVMVAGRPVPTIQHGGKTYLPVPSLGAEYQIRVWNHGPRRIAALVSVDGLAVVNGQPAADDNPGYVVSPSGSVTIKGWRRDLRTVAAFRFVEREKSYAALMGRPEGVGIISLLAIEERVRTPRPLIERDSAPAFGKQGSGKLGSAGTGYGHDIDSGAYYVPFARSANRWRVTVYYDTVRALREAGVPLDLLPLTAPPPDTPFAPPPRAR